RTVSRSRSRVARTDIPKPSIRFATAVTWRSHEAVTEAIRSGTRSSHGSASAPTRARTAASNRSSGSVEMGSAIGQAAYLSRCPDVIVARASVSSFGSAVGTRSDRPKVRYGDTTGDAD